MAAGVVIRAGACYYVYRLTWGTDDSEKIWDYGNDNEDRYPVTLQGLVWRLGKEVILGWGPELDFRVTQRPRLRWL